MTTSKEEIECTEHWVEAYDMCRYGVPVQLVGDSNQEDV